MGELASTVVEDIESIKTFVELVNSTTGDGIITFDQLQTRPFMKFWPNLIICRYIEDQDDFRIIFFGTYLVQNFSREPTGELVGQRVTEKSGRPLRDVHMDVMKSDRPSYSSGDLAEISKDFKKWYQVKMPLKRNSLINETLSYVVFD